jgi:hypothetical protein
MIKLEAVDLLLNCYFGNCLYGLAPQVGLEPTTLRLTVAAGV